VIEVYPVSLVVGEVDHNARGTRCPVDRVAIYGDWHAASRTRGAHNAQDIFAPRKSLVLAPEAGQVLRSTKRSGPSERGGHTLTLYTSGAARRIYYFAHMDAPPLFQRGDRVQAGQQIGLVGKTGNAASTCPHLHISASELRNGRRVKVNIYQELLAVDPTRPSTQRAGGCGCRCKGCRRGCEK